VTAPAITRPATGTTITIPVTGGHIWRGTPCRADLCPIALAIFDAIPGTAQADVWRCQELHCRQHGGHVHAHVVIHGIGSVRLRFGCDAYEFTGRVDALLPVLPATFTAEMIA
jgi:hypothetical protein